MISTLPEVLQWCQPGDLKTPQEILDYQSEDIPDSVNHLNLQLAVWHRLSPHGLFWGPCVGSYLSVTTQRGFLSLTTLIPFLYLSRIELIIELQHFKFERQLQTQLFFSLSFTISFLPQMLAVLWHFNLFWWFWGI